MDIFLIIGISVGAGAILTGLLLNGVNPAILANVEALLIIFIGTGAAVMNAFPKNEFLKIPKILGALFKEKEKVDTGSLIRQIVEMSQTSRKNGLLALEQLLEGMENKFMKKGFGMVVDGTEPEYIREVLEIEIDSMEERHRLGASIFTTAGGSAPTLGVMGAVVGLITALGNLADTAKLGSMIASAFVATLYGIFVGYVICHPFASRLKRKSHEEIAIMHIMLEGILAIQAGENPKSIEKKLLGMVEPAERAKIEAEAGEK